MAALKQQKNHIYTNVRPTPISKTIYGSLETTEKSSKMNLAINFLTINLNNTTR